MGFVKDVWNAAVGSYDGALSDAWLEAISCEEYKPGQLVAIGKVMHGARSSNTSATPDVITDGSKIFVGISESALVIENGKIINVFSESGEHTFHSDQTKSVFSGDSLGEGLRNLNNDAKERFTFGGDKAVVQKVYYINQKEIMGNPFKATGIPVRIHVPSINYDVDCSCSLSGVYSFKVVDPVAFYRNFVGNRESGYYADALQGLVESILLTGVQPAIARLFSAGMRPSAMIEYVEALAKAICEEVTQELGPMRGLGLVSCGISSFTLEGADLRYLKQFERDSTLKDPTMAGAHLVGATAEAMETIAYTAETASGPTGYALIGATMAPPPPRKRYWTCKCGKMMTGKFCTSCGQAELFECPECGTVDTGKFCPNCGHKLREG